MTYQLLPVPLEHVEALRAFWEPALLRCARHDQADPAEWIRRVLSGESVVMLVMRADGTSIAAFAVECNDGSADVLWLGGAHPEKWFYLIDRFERFAKDALGCTRSRIMMRPGFQRLFRKHGYHLKSVVLERRFE